jgi:hypothetical protein
VAPRPSGFESLGGAVNFLAASLGISVLAVGLAQWVVSLAKESEALMQEDKFVQTQAGIAVRAIDIIQKQNRLLDGLDLACAGGAILSPASLATLRRSGQLIARLQDSAWQQLRLKLSLSRSWHLADFASTFRKVPQGCAPGRFDWKDRRLIQLQSREAGIEVSLIQNAPRWSFSSARVIRRLR